MDMSVSGHGTNKLRTSFAWDAENAGMLILRVANPEFWHQSHNSPIGYLQLF